MGNKALKPNLGNQQKGEGSFVQKERGTHNELEILSDIVANTAAVRTQILARLREAKARLQKKKGA
jgi:hypothetical protein